MVYRYTGIAVFAVLAFAFTLLNGLLRPTVEGPPWQFVVLAGLALGAVITWTGLTYRMRGWVTALINVVALVIVSFRIAAPETLVFLFPTSDSMGAMDTQLTQAMRLIRTGIEPVIPVSGLVVIVTAVFWGIGAFAAYALLRGRPVLAVVPGLVLTLQFATMDRSPTGWLRILVFVVLLAGAVLAITWDERASTAGRMAHASGHRPSRNLLGRATSAALGVTLLGSVLAVGVLRDQVPYDGMLTWRAATGLTGDFYGSSVSYNPFVSVQQSLVTSTETPLFVANVSGDIDAERLYFRLLTLETYNGGKFSADQPLVDPLESEEWEDPAGAFAGPTATVNTTIIISLLDMEEWLPAAYSPTAVVDTDETLVKSMRVRKDDGSLLLEGGRSFEGLTYSVTSEVPQPDYDSLASTSSGTLSPLFAVAAENDQLVPTPVLSAIRPEPPNVERYLQLPDDLDERIGQLAQEKTRNLQTPFEIGLGLETWFRSGDFRYTTDIEPGHGATDMAQWLLDPEFEYHRAGYCENFAASMAVMARTLGVPSRVVLGFTPGQSFDPEGVDGNWIVVRDRNAHAWVELWMPSQGWVRFDPTPRPDEVNPRTTGDIVERFGFDPAEYLPDIPTPVFNDPRLDQPGSFQDPGLVGDENFENLNLEDLIAPGAAQGRPAWLTTALLGLLGLIVLAGALPLLKVWRHRRRMARLRTGDITAAWEDIVARLEDFGERPAPTLTPDELADRVDPAMRPLAATYGRAVYGAPGSVDESHVAAATKSLEQTSQRLTGRYSRTQRIVAWYRPASLVPERWRQRNR